jgi:Ca2+/Na+ antiporter
MAKSAAKFDQSSAQRVKLDPFNGILGVFFVVVACILPVAMPASDGRLNVLHYVGIASCCLLAAFFFWRWVRAHLAHALRDETEEEVARVRAATFAQDEQARNDTSGQDSPGQAPVKT